MATVLLVDDHPLIRQGVKSLLKNETDLEVIGESGDGLEAFQMVERLRPNVALLDLMLPGLNGLDLTLQISKRAPKTKVLILSMHEDEAYALDALRKGASGYFLKRCVESDLVSAIREVAAGRKYLSYPLSERAIELYARKAENASLDPYETLTVREREVLHLAVEGNTHAQIADRLFISQRTAQHHRERFMRKLGLHSHTELIRFAIRRGILSADA